MSGKRSLLSNSTSESIVIANGRHYTAQEWFDGCKAGELDPDTPHETLAPGNRFASEDEIDYHVGRIVEREAALLNSLAKR